MRGLGHFQHERRTAPGEIVGGADARENTIERPQHGALRGHETTHMRKDGDERRLAHIRALTAHVGAGNDEHTAQIVEAHVVGDEGLAAGALDHGMPTLIDEQQGTVDQFRLSAVKRHGALGEAGQHVDLGDRRGGLLQGRQACGQEFQQRVVQIFLACQRSIAGAQDLVLEGFQFGRDESLGGLDGLTAQIVGRHSIGLTAIYFDEKSLHAVEAQLQAGQPRALAFAALEIEQELLRVGAQEPQFIELRVVARCDHATVAQIMRRRFHHRAGQHGVLVAMVAQFADKLLEQGRCSVLQRSVQRLLKVRQGAERGAQLREVPRPCRTQCNPGQYSLQVTDGAQHLRQGHVAGRLDERRDHLIAKPQRRVIAQGSMQPAPQQAPAHGGGGAIEYAGEREFRSAGEALVQFQITPRRRIHDEGGIAFFGGDG